MSRGPGKVQRRLLEIFNMDNDMPLFETEELAGRVYETRKLELGGMTRYFVTRAQVFATQRRVGSVRGQPQKEEVIAGVGIGPNFGIENLPLRAADAASAISLR